MELWLVLPIVLLALAVIEELFEIRKGIYRSRDE